MDKIYTNENRLNAYTNVKVSPSGKYYVKIELYKINPVKNEDNRFIYRTNYSRGLVIRVADNKQIFDIKRNYSSFPFHFFQRDGDEWLICSRKYLSQSFINLDKEVEYERPVEASTEFCWTKYYISPDGNTIATDSYELEGYSKYKFYDISNLESGNCSEIKCDDFLFIDDSSNLSNSLIGWNDNHTFTWEYKKEWSNRFEKWFDELTIHEMDQLMETLCDEIEYILQERKILYKKDNMMILKESIKI